MSEPERRALLFGRVRRILRRLRLQRGGAATPILIRRAAAPPEVSLAARALLVVILIAGVFAVFLFDRDGLRDHIDGHVSLTDVLYFTMITITTVGYGDIVPVSDQARLIDAFLVTPARIFVWFIFLGTAYQLIIERVLEDWRMTRLQQQLAGHVIICGYGHAGSIAALELLHRGREPERIVIIDADRDTLQQAAERGFVCLHGDASSGEMLRVAGVERAEAVILSLSRDDTTVLSILRIRAIAKRVRVVARVREQQNFQLAREGGADEIVSPPRLGGLLLADAVGSRDTVDFVSNLISFSGDYQLVERTPQPGEVGARARELDGSLVVEIERRGRRIGAWSDRELRIEEGDRLLVIDSDRVLATRRTAGRVAG